MRYYLHQIQGDEIVQDPEGGNYPDLAAAEREAIEAAREMMATAIRASRDISDWAIDITDAQGVRLRRVLFANTVQRRARADRTIPRSA